MAKKLKNAAPGHTFKVVGVYTPDLDAKQGCMPTIYMGHLEVRRLLPSTVARVAVRQAKSATAPCCEEDRFNVVKLLSWSNKMRLFTQPNALGDQGRREFFLSAALSDLTDEYAGLARGTPDSALVEASVAASLLSSLPDYFSGVAQTPEGAAFLRDLLVRHDLMVRPLVRARLTRRGALAC